jgi:hypothetical protein
VIKKEEACLSRTQKETRKTSAKVDNKTENGCLLFTEAENKRATTKSVALKLNNQHGTT